MKKIIGFIFSMLVLLNISCSNQRDIFINNFEDESFGDWKVEGEAFGNGPTGRVWPIQSRINGLRGKKVANSIHKGEKSTGSLSSPKFIIERNYINFLIGGGEIPDSTGLYLIVEDSIIYKSTGNNQNNLQWQSWKVSNFNGKTAQIIIFDSSTGKKGYIMADYIVQSNISATLAKPDLVKQITCGKRYLVFPVKTGAEMRDMKVVIDSETVRRFDIELADNDSIDFWAFLDLTEFIGKSATIMVNQFWDSDPDGLKTVVLSDTIIGESGMYKEKYRPQVHFTPRRGWMNDVNGLVYYKGEYHMFFQHNPYGINWGNMHWGHAVSKDLVHWQELPIAIYPDKMGTIFSGSGVVDVDNATGFQTGDEDPLVCIYSSAGGQSKESQGKPFTQCLSYSLDRGRSFTKYEHNPVIENIEGPNRDPKVFWHEPSKQWIMSMVLVNHKFTILGSPDLKNWTRYSDVIMKDGVDCPDLFELAVDGNKGKKKWVFQVGNSEYAVGSFDGKTFKPESEIIMGNFGDCFYAAQTWDNIPIEDSRRIQIAWMKYTTPGMAFNSATTFPCELSLKTTEEGIRLFTEPVKEIESLHGKEYQWIEEVITEGKNMLDGISGDLFEIRAELEADMADSVGFIIRGIPLVYDIARQELRCRKSKASLKTEKGKIYLQVLIDRSSIEIFANHGRVYMPIGVTPKDEVRDLVLFTSGAETKVNSLQVFEMKSSWIDK